MQKTNKSGWSKDDEQFLMDNIGLGLSNLANVMHKPYKTIYAKAKRLGLELKPLKQGHLNVRVTKETPYSVEIFKQQASDLTLLLFCKTW